MHLILQIPVVLETIRTRTCLEEKFKKLKWNGKGNKTGHGHLNLRYADDIALFGESANELQLLINDLTRESLKVGLKMIRKKTKVMFNSRGQYEMIHVQGKALECVHPVTKNGLETCYNQVTEAKINKNLKRNGKVDARKRNRMRATWIRKQTQVKDILKSVKTRKAVACSICRRQEHRWT
ncbi:uncharacterized protein LOC119576967 [Penaeus monodon]|uniref:uncharacterized protein LOC119576967 n=1 Tax=Penaeus monodon TaxID=6687 RepID=UPI0018A79545|nr:uncharacterized protein LOC119576967 [Penaeus monodon]